MVDSSSAHKKTGKRGGNKFAAMHLLYFASSTLALVIAAILLIAEYNVIGVLVMLAGIGIAYAATRFN